MILAQMRLPERPAFFRTGNGELDDRIEPAEERWVEPGAAVAGEEYDSVEVLDALEQVVGLGVGKAVVGLLHVRAFSEHRIGFVEKKNHFRMLGARQQLSQILLSLADILAGYGGEIDPVEREAESRGQPAARQRLSGPRRSGEKRPRTLTVLR